MNSIRLTSEADGGARDQANGDSKANARLGLADRVALRGIFRFLCFFVGYLFVVSLLGEVFRWSRLTGAMLQFIPYCFVLAGVAYCGRTLARGDKQTLLMASCLACVFVILGLDVTKNLDPLAAVPIIGRDSRVRNDIASIAILVALGSFPGASYLMIQELLLAKRQLDEQVEKLQDALRHVQRLQGLLPICMYCHKIRTDQQSWQRLELYISEHSEATFTHGLCPECARKHHPELKS
jgi:hypothetical protein